MKKRALGTNIMLVLTGVVMLAGCSLQGERLEMPSEFTVELNEDDNNSVQLSWNYPWENEEESTEGYQGVIIERRASNDVYGEIARTGPEEHTYVDNDMGSQEEHPLEYGMTYYYRIAYFGDKSTSYWTEEKSVTIPELEPYQLSPPDWIQGGLWQDAGSSVTFIFTADNVMGNIAGVPFDLKTENEGYAAEGMKETGYKESEVSDTRYYLHFWELSGQVYYLDFSKTGPHALDYTSDRFSGAISLTR